MSKSCASIGRLASAAAVLGGAFAVAVGLASMVCAQGGNATADLVLGQIDSTHDIVNLGGLTGFYDPVGVAIDPNGHVYVADALNNRVLGWATAAKLTSGASADLVIGQPDGFSNSCTRTQTGLCFSQGGFFDQFPEPPAGAIATDLAGNLFVADVQNFRVLEFDSPFGSGMTVDQPAHLVFGQGGSFTSRNFGCSQLQTGLDVFCIPTAVASDPAGNLYVADPINDRVLEFNTPLVQTDVRGSGDTTPDLVFPWCDGPPAANCLFAPLRNGGLATDSAGNLYIADRSRVLEFNTPLAKTAVPGSGDTIADMVFGQNGKFTTDVCSGGEQHNPGNPGPSAGGLCEAGGLTVDPAGNLYVADTGNNRVLEYNTPLKKTKVRGSGDTIADRVFGQKNFAATVPADGVPNVNSKGQPFFDPEPSARGLSMPESVAVDSLGNLYVADTFNNRVLEYNTPLEHAKVRGSGDTSADSVGGQAHLTDNAINSAGPRALKAPSGVAIDTAGHLYVADGLNNRVLGWKSTGELANGAPADIVIGQPDFFSTTCATTRSRLCFLAGTISGSTGGSFPLQGAVAVDRDGNLYVADSLNSRVLEYDGPFKNRRAAGQPAHLVLGQHGSFTRNICGPPLNIPPSSPLNAEEICYPSGVALDGKGNLYIADNGNNRVLEYNTPMKKTKVHGSGDTIADLAFGGGENEFGLLGPTGVAVDAAGNLWVADSLNNRVLEYNTPLKVTSVPGSGDTGADLVLGQMGSFSSFICTGNDPFGVASQATADGLCQPVGVAVDSAGNVYVSDSFNNRALEYNNPLATLSSPNTTADVVFGQGGSFTSSGCNGGLPGSPPPSSFPQPPPASGTLCLPQGIAVDSAGNLWVADTTNNRVLKLNTPVAAANSHSQ